MNTPTALATAFTLVLAGGNALAQAYPAKPVRFVIGFPAGSGIDTMARVLLDDIRKETGAVVVVENKPGALGQIGTDFTAKSAPDGYTVMISSSATHSSGPQLAKKLPYDALRDFTHIGRLNRFDVALLVSPSQPFRTPADLIAAARKTPDALTFGFGSATAHVTAASFTRAADIKVRAIPYKGQPAAITDLLGGQVNFVMADLAVSLPHVKSGRLNAIAVAAAKRSTLLPDVATLTELGIRDVELSGWTGISGPAGMAKEAVQWWSAQLNRALSNKAFLERQLGIAVEGEPNTVEEFNRYVVQQFEVWGRKIREAGIEPE